MRFEGTVSCWNVFPKVPAPLARRGDSPAPAQGLKVVFAPAQGAESGCPLSAYRQTMVMLSNVSAGKRNLKGKVLRFDQPDGRRGFKIDGPAGPSPLSGANTTLLHNLRRQRCPRRPVFTAICLICGMYQVPRFFVSLRMIVSGG